MPITQSRFLRVVDGAINILNLFQDVIRISKSIESDITIINSTMEQMSDPAARQALTSAVGTLVTIQNLVTNGITTNMETIGVILVEKQHFHKKKAANDRAAAYQRRMRENQAATTNVGQNKTHNDSLDSDPNFIAFQKIMQEQREATPSLSLPQAAIAQSQAEGSLVAQVGSDGTTRYVPSQADLAKLEIEPGGDIF